MLFRFLETVDIYRIYISARNFMGGIWSGVETGAAVVNDWRCGLQKVGFQGSSIEVPVILGLNRGNCEEIIC